MVPCYIQSPGEMALRSSLSTAITAGSESRKLVPGFGILKKSTLNSGIFMLGSGNAKNVLKCILKLTGIFSFAGPFTVSEALVRGYMRKVAGALRHDLPHFQ